MDKKREQSNSNKKITRRKRGNRRQTKSSNGYKVKNRLRNHQGRATGATKTERSRAGNSNHNPIEQEELAAGEASRDRRDRVHKGVDVTKNANRRSLRNLSNAPPFCSKQVTLSALSAPGANGTTACPTKDTSCARKHVELKYTDRSLDSSASSQRYGGKSADFLYNGKATAAESKSKVEEHEVEEHEVEEHEVDEHKSEEHEVEEHEVEEHGIQRTQFPMFSRKQKAAFTRYRSTMASMNMTLRERFGVGPEDQTTHLVDHCENRLICLVEDGTGDAKSRDLIRETILLTQHYVNNEVHITDLSIIELLEFIDQHDLLMQQRAAEASIRLHHRLPLFNDRNTYVMYLDGVKIIYIFTEA